MLLDDELVHLPLGRLDRSDSGPSRPLRACLIATAVRGKVLPSRSQVFRLASWMWRGPWSIGNLISGMRMHTWVVPTTALHALEPSATTIVPARS